MKKKLFTAAILTVSALAIVVVSVLGTIAYLTANSAVSNVFTVGNVSIAMFEHKVGEDGQIPAGSTVETDTNSYHLVCGKTFDKDPTIRITSTLNQDQMYLFVKSSNQIRGIEAGNTNDPADADARPSMREQMEANGWVEFVRSGDGIEIVWVYGTRDPENGQITPTAVGPDSIQYKKAETVGQAPVPVFGDAAQENKGLFRLCEEFTVAKNADISLYAAAKVNFTGFAIQTSGFGGATDSALTKAAWDAIKAVYPYEGGIISPVNPYDPALKDDNAYNPVGGVEDATFPAAKPGTGTEDMSGNA